MKKTPTKMEEKKPATSPKAALKQEKAEGKKHFAAIQQAIKPKKGK